MFAESRQVVVSMPAARLRPCVQTRYGSMRRACAWFRLSARPGAARPVRSCAHVLTRFRIRKCRFDADSFASGTATGRLCGALCIALRGDCIDKPAWVLSPSGKRWAPLFMAVLHGARKSHSKRNSSDVTRCQTAKHGCRPTGGRGAGLLSGARPPCFCASCAPQIMQHPQSHKTTSMWSKFTL